MLMCQLACRAGLTTNNKIERAALQTSATPNNTYVAYIKLCYQFLLSALCVDIPQVTINENIAGVEKEKSDIEGRNKTGKTGRESLILHIRFLFISGNFAASKTKWTETMTDLQKKLVEISPICAHVNKSTNAK